jgi:hypothetical protein
MTHPYKDMPGKAFWKSGVANASPFNPGEIYTKKWNINPEARIATAGSCFAQHISHYLKHNGFNVLDLEPPPPGLPEKLHRQFGYSMYSARYGNIYTVQQLLQLAQEISGDFRPSNYIWKKNGKFFDALRPGVEPKGLDSEDEVRLHRKYHLARVKEMFQKMDLFIFTFGLTEAWIHKASETVYPTAPGTIAGTFDKSHYAFKNYTFQEVIQAFNEFQQTIAGMRENKTFPRIILTVSPVPLTATASNNHILQATTYSKSILRAVAGQVSTNQPHVDYFPSFEIITNQAARGCFYETNLRSIRIEGVETAMKIFFKEHYPVANNNPTPSTPPPTVELTDEDIQCEDAILEAFNDE